MEDFSDDNLRIYGELKDFLQLEKELFEVRPFCECFAISINEFLIIDERGTIFNFDQDRFLDSSVGTGCEGCREEFSVWIRKYCEFKLRGRENDSRY